MCYDKSIEEEVEGRKKPWGNYVVFSELNPGHEYEIKISSQPEGRGVDGSISSYW